MNQALSGALRELESSTDALLGTDTSDLEHLRDALERRACAISRVAALAGELERAGPEAERRLKDALQRGDRMTQSLLAMKQSAIDEWTRLNRIASIEEGRPGAARTVDYSG